jgi:inosine-uridine nucleoside N-ribohydrolase
LSEEPSWQVHGNTSAQNTANNAARCLHAFGAPEWIHVYPGASQPLIRPPKHDPEIHGEDGLASAKPPTSDKVFIEVYKGCKIKNICKLYS